MEWHIQILSLRIILGYRADKYKDLYDVTYDAVLIKIFENKVRNIEGLRVIVKKYIKKKQEEDSNRRAKDLAEILKSVQGDNTNNIAASTHHNGKQDKVYNTVS